MKTKTEITRESVGGKIAEAMADAGVKSTPLAAYIGVSESTLRRFIDGQTEPSYRQVVRMSEFLGKPLGWFVEAAA